MFDRDGRLIAWNAPVRRACSTLPIDLTRRHASRHSAAAGDARRFRPGRIRSRGARARRALLSRPADGQRAHHRDRARVADPPPRACRTAASSRSIPTSPSARPPRRRWRRRCVAGRTRQPRQERFSRQYEPRAAHAAQRHHRLLRDAVRASILGPVDEPEAISNTSSDIHSSGLLLLSIINDVLDMSKIEAGKLELAHEEVVVQPARSARRSAWSASGPAAASSTWSPRCPTTRSRSGATSGRSSRSCSTCCRTPSSSRMKAAGSTSAPRSTRPRDLVLEVEDYGIGMTEDEIDRALQPFGQAKPAIDQDAWRHRARPADRQGPGRSPWRHVGDRQPARARHPGSHRAAAAIRTADAGRLDGHARAGRQ